MKFFMMNSFIKKLWFLNSLFMKKLFIVLFLIPVNNVFAESLFDYELHNLKSGEKESLAQLKGSETLFVLFEPDCSWCHRQIRTLNNLLKQCDSLQAAALGVFGNRSSYKKSLRSMRPNFSAFEMSKSLFDNLGGQSTLVATPMLLFVDADGQLVTYARGYQNQEKLLLALEKYLPEYCDKPAA